MDEVALNLDPAMVDNMRREADTHGFDDLDGYVQWLLQRRETVLNEFDAWENPPGADDPDADLSQSSTDGTLDPDDGGFEPLEEATDETTEEDVELPEEKDSADDDDVAAALEEIEFDDEEP